MTEARPHGQGLEVRHLAVSYGQHRALKGVDLQVGRGEIVVILGANGAGKTSLLQAVAGLVKAEPASQVLLDGRPLTQQSPHRVVEAGLALVPEGRGIFGDLSVAENLTLGAYAHRARDGEASRLQQVLTLFPRLAERQQQTARTMSGGEQQMVAIGRALMSAPTILMLDEPSLGLSPLLCRELFKNLQAVRDTGVGILLVEQNARQSLAIADRAYLLENGSIVGQGRAQDMLHDPAVQAAYLGGAAGHAAAPAAATSRPVSTPITAPAPLSVPAAAPTSTVSADALVPTRIADLVRIASQRQAEAVQAAAAQMPRLASLERLPGSTASPATGSASLDDWLHDISHAAQQARQPRRAPLVAAHTGRSDSGPDHPAPARPQLEIWRRPGIEKYRRQADGQLHKET
jgi:branched-chain amino acid transport system ATP-binding protein